MNVFVDNPVLKREIRRRLRIRIKSVRLKWRLWGYVLAGLLLYICAQGMVSVWLTDQYVADGWWNLAIYSSLVVICLFAPMDTAKSISQERERGTWETLALTRLSAAQVLIGKWSAQTAAIAWVPVGLLPFLIASGAATRDFNVWTTLAIFAYLILNCVFFVGIGLVCSFGVSRSRVAMVSAILVAAAICLGTALIDLGINAAISSDSLAFALNINPFYGLQSIADCARRQGDFPDQAMGIRAVTISIGFELTVIVFAFFGMQKRYGKASLR
jgi:ABC-type transport system involved in multi-copper enzyme maturation permease subunit